MHKCVPDSTYLKPPTVKPPAKFGEMNRGEEKRGKRGVTHLALDQRERREGDPHF
jgi:hypothetical protein